MNQDFRVAVSLPTHPKSLKLMRRCGDRAFYCLIRFWAFVAVSRPDGNLTGLDEDDIEIASDWTGEQSEFYKALIDLKFVDSRDGALFVHDWPDHNGFACHAKDRKARAVAAAERKWGSQGTNKAKRSERLSAARECASHTATEWDEMVSFFCGMCVKCNGATNLDGVVKDHIIPIYQGGCDGIRNLQPLCAKCNAGKGPESVDYRLVFCSEHGIKMPAKWLPSACQVPAKCLLRCGITPTPSPNPSPSPIEIESTIVDSCAELSPKAPALPPVISIPLSKKGQEFHVTQALVDQYADSYPGVDVMLALKDIRQWNMDNPGKRKTKTGVKGHITRWLSRAQNKGEYRRKEPATCRTPEWL